MWAFLSNFKEPGYCMAWKRQQEQGLANDLFEITFTVASKHPRIGFVVAVAFGVIASGFYAADPKSMYGMGKLIGLLILMLALGVFFVSLAALVKSIFGGGRPSGSRRPDPSSRTASRRNPSNPPIVRQSFAPVPAGREKPANPYLAGEPLPYQRRHSLFTKGELAFYHPLLHVVNGRYAIFGKVRLADLVITPPDTRRAKFWFRMVSQKHIDFVLCHPATLKPLLAIELDDRSHSTREAAKSDNFKNLVFARTGIPLLRIPCQIAYDVEELRTELRKHSGTPAINPA
jgi:hypothetical protein